MPVADREHLLRLTPDRALETFDDAEAFLLERGMLTLTPDSSLPSLFGATHEPPYKPGSRGFGLWPRTKWPWAFELAARHLAPRIHRGKQLYLAPATVEVVDLLCREELARADDGAAGSDAARLLAHLREAGPALVEDLKVELGLSSAELRLLRGKLERRGAIVARFQAFEDPAANTSELWRWDQLHPEASGRGGLDDLLVAGVRAAVAAPEREARSWFGWRVEAQRIERLVEEGRLRRSPDGPLSAAETASR